MKKKLFYSITTRIEFLEPLLAWTIKINYKYAVEKCSSFLGVNRRFFVRPKIDPLRIETVTSDLNTKNISAYNKFNVSL